jgi:tetratricopeptide (TPR) repeat protein
MVHVGLLVGGLLALARRSPAWRTAGLGVWGFYLSMGPVSNLIPIGVVFADRLLFTPSVWWTLVVAAGLCGLSGRRAALTVLLLLGLGASAARLAPSVQAWTNNEALWETSHARFPESPRIQLAVALQRLEHGRPAAARPLFEHALAGFSPPGRWRRQAAQARAGLAMVIMEEDPGGAWALLQEAATLDPGQREVALGISRLCMQRAAASDDARLRDRWIGRAITAVQAAARVAPHSYELWLRLGTVLMSAPGSRARVRHTLGDLAGSCDDRRQVALALERLPALTREQEEALSEAWLLGGALAAKLGRADEARRSWEALHRRYPARLPRAALEKLLHELGGDG